MKNQQYIRVIGTMASPMVMGESSTLIFHITKDCSSNRKPVLSLNPTIMKTAFTFLPMGRIIVGSLTIQNLKGKES